MATRKTPASDAVKRRELGLPDGWKPTHHANVQVLEHAKLAPAELSVAGHWRCIEQAPGSCWWLLPADDASRRWLAVHGQAAGALSGMIAVHRLRLVPSFLQLAL